jgi:WYL domain
MAGPGRDQVTPMRRFVRIMAVLDKAGAPGASAARLIEVGQYGDKDPATQLGKDLQRLRQQGWQIDNVAGKGEPAVYRMTAGDNRLRLKLTPGQLAALQRAVILSRPEDIAEHPSLDTQVLPDDSRDTLTLALRAVRLRALIRFVYKGTPRVLNPGTVRFEHVHWYLSGVEEGNHEPKNFAVDRMRDVSLDLPGSAPDVPEVRRLTLHPLSWELDEPVEVTLRTDPGHVPDVVRWLREPQDERPAGELVDLTYRVTNRSAFRARVYGLATRVQVVAPESFRRELVAELRELVGL